MFQRIRATVDIIQVQNASVQIIKYRGKISGPIMNRIDIQKEVKSVDFFGLKNEESSIASEQMRTKIEKEI